MGFAIWRFRFEVVLLAKVKAARSALHKKDFAKRIEGDSWVETFSRPFGTRMVSFEATALKRRAIFESSLWDCDLRIISDLFSQPPKAKAKQAAEERAQGKTEGAGQEFSRLFKPKIDAAQNHEDQAGGNKIHRVSPNGGEGPIAAVAGIAGQVPGEGVQDFGNAPGVHRGMANVSLPVRNIGADEIEMTRGADLEYERSAITPGGGPKNFSIDVHLAHKVAGLIEIAR